MSSICNPVEINTMVSLKKKKKCASWFWMFCEDTEARLELEVTVGHRKGPSQLVCKGRQDIRPILSR